MKTVVLLSGGKKSTAVLFWALNKGCYDIVAVTFSDLSNKESIECAKSVAKMADVNHLVMPQDEFNDRFHEYDIDEIISGESCHDHLFVESTEGLKKPILQKDSLDIWYMCSKISQLKTGRTSLCDNLVYSVKNNNDRTKNQFNVVEIVRRLSYGDHELSYQVALRNGLIS